jgi:soluble lytic murein transglycosylase-like protein
MFDGPVGIVQANPTKDNAAKKDDTFMASSYRIAALLMILATSAIADSSRFSAADAPGFGIKKQGRIVIRNDETSISAFRFFGSVREALVTLRSSRNLKYSPFGGSVFDSTARVNTPMPVYLANVINDAAKAHGIDPRLLAAVAHQESRFNAAAVSPVGACGVMQLMPATARFLGVQNVFDARQNVFAGARYLRTLLDTFHGDLDLTLAAYNAGPGAVQKYNGVPPFRETRNYVASIRAKYQRALSF